MKFLANENFPAPSVALLRSKGWDVSYICEDCPSISDEAVLQLAMHEHRTVLTHDRDYGELVFRRGYRPQAGVVYFRLENYAPEEPATILLQLSTSENFQVEGLFTVIDGWVDIRQRKIP